MKKRSAKPFVKWAGGKRQLLSTIDSYLPDLSNEHAITYVEPFVGGGAMMFHMLKKYHNVIERIIINDINKDLIHCYRLIKKSPNALINRLRLLEDRFYSYPSMDERKEYYYEIRNAFNSRLKDSDDNAAYFMFLNHTCFNGLYRENGDGNFNVPFGRYKKPIICDADIILADSKALNSVKVDIKCGNYDKALNGLEGENVFVYFDPPYRPLAGSSNFVGYSKSGFGDEEQKQLKKVCDELTQRGVRLMLSNSNSTNEDGSNFFELLYEEYFINKISANRNISANGEKRQKEIELLIQNYSNVPNVNYELFEL